MPVSYSSEAYFARLLLVINFVCNFSPEITRVLFKKTCHQCMAGFFAFGNF
jgi:hypothetical protein